MPPRLHLAAIGSSSSLWTTSCQSACRNAARQASSGRPHAYTTSSRHHYEIDVERDDRPRWQETPTRMVAPVRLKTFKPENEYPVNEDPRRLDQVYVHVLGQGGDKMLTDEVKWLAVTHKSFDQGRRGYNDRLAFFGKRIVDLQTSLALLHNYSTSGPLSQPEDSFGREPFHHPALSSLSQLTASEAVSHPEDLFGRRPFHHRDLSSLSQLTEDVRKDTKSKRRIAEVAERYGLLDVLRWKPKAAWDLPGSGSELVLAQALYAIVGAVALQKGGEMATRVTKERILSCMGLN